MNTEKTHVIEESKYIYKIKSQKSQKSEHVGVHSYWTNTTQAQLFKNSGNSNWCKLPIPYQS